ncbi:serine protease [Amylibacter marinus]|uniref:Serine protease n=1 Tax=Amylibacter marinus TaxID=1475483 RepID=A0ABQ5VVI5_9RHOB|nr:CAP domain-containing protein [Amylibacter marinus]GLQ35446.1 serine protease [Amylibacter marinus]
MVKALLCGAALFALVACETTTQNGGRPGDGTVVVRLSKYKQSKIEFRHLDAVNAVRQANGQTQVVLDAALNAAARGHAADMARQNRPWHFGSDGSSPYDRAANAGFAGVFEGENISETFEDDFTTLDVWMKEPLSRAVILDGQANAMGIGWHQEKSGKIWWVQVFGTAALTQ